MTYTRTFLNFSTKTEQTMRHHKTKKNKSQEHRDVKSKCCRPGRAVLNLDGTNKLQSNRCPKKPSKPTIEVCKSYHLSVFDFDCFLQLLTILT